MKSVTVLILMALASAAFSGAAMAGSTTAGPAAGSGVVGSTVVPAAAEVLKVPEKDNNGRGVAPGEAGAVMLVGEQLTSVRQALTGSEGVTMEGSVIRVPTTLGDGAAAMIVLDTGTGQLMVVRNAR